MISSLAPVGRSETSWHALVRVLAAAQPLPGLGQGGYGAVSRERVTDAQRFLGRSKRAFYLLRRDPTEEFPAPFLIQGRDHSLMRDLLEWIESRRRRDAIPGRTALSNTDRSSVLAAPDA